MKKFIIGILVFMPLINTYAQELDSVGAALADKILIIPHISLTSDIPQDAQPLMLDKMKQALLRQGVIDSSDRSRFMLTVRSNVLDGNWTETVPRKYAVKVMFSFYIGDVDTGILFSNQTITRKGVADNESKAYLNAVKQIQAADPLFKKLVDEAKPRIIQSLQAREDAGEIDPDKYDINWW